MRNLHFSENFVINSLISLLGVVLLTQLTALFYKQVFYPDGFSLFLNHYAEYTSVWGKNFFAMLSSYQRIIGPLWGLVLLSLAFCLLTHRFVKISLLITSIGFLVVWILLSTNPSIWTFEFLFPALFAFYLLLSYQYQYQHHYYFRHCFFSLAKILFLSFLIYIVTRLSLEPNIAQHAAISASLLFILLIGIDYLIQLFDKNPPTQVSLSNGIIRPATCLTIMTLTMGAMLVMQVHANINWGLYTAKGFAFLLDTYAKTTASHWLSPILLFFSQWASVFLPVYIGFEVLITVFMCLLLLRGLTILSSALLFGFLAFAEFGISGGFYTSDLTWQWELLLATCVALLISLHEIEKCFFIKKNSSFKLAVRKIFWGEPLFTGSVSFSIMLSVIASLCLYASCFFTHIFEHHVQLYLCSTSGIFFILLLIRIYIDKYFIF